MIESEILTIIELIMNSAIFKWTIGTSVVTLMGWALASIKKTNDKIKKSVTEDQLDCAKNAAFKYTDDRMKVHENLQLLELTDMKKNIKETHEMVTVIYTNAINKN